MDFNIPYTYCKTPLSCQLMQVASPAVDYGMMKQPHEIHASIQVECLGGGISTF